MSLINPTHEPVGDAMSDIGRGGDKLGKVDHIMLDVPGGRIAYAVLSFGGFLGMGGKLFAVPWSALTLDVQRKSFVLGIEKEVLEAGPGRKAPWIERGKRIAARGNFQHAARAVPGDIQPWIQP